MSWLCIRCFKIESKHNESFRLVERAIAIFFCSPKNCQTWQGKYLEFKSSPHPPSHVLNPLGQSSLFSQTLHQTIRAPQLFPFQPNSKLLGIQDSLASYFLQNKKHTLGIVFHPHEGITSLSARAFSRLERDARRARARLLQLPSVSRGQSQQQRRRARQATEEEREEKTV